MNQLINNSTNQLSSLQSSTTSTSYSLQHLPHEIIHVIVGTDMRIYNALGRTCHALAAAYTLSTRLDFMIAVGVTVRLYVTVAGPMINWLLCGEPHSVFGPAQTWLNGNRAYMRRGCFHRCDGPAWIHKSEFETSISWYRDCVLHRDIDQPAATGAAFLCGAASIAIRGGVITVVWYTKGRAVRKLTVSENPLGNRSQSTCELSYAECMAATQAEIDYWRV
jgi:hypothetical protein